MKTVEEIDGRAYCGALRTDDAKRRPPADRAALAELESRFQVRLPSDVRAFWTPTMVSLEPVLVPRSLRRSPNFSG